MIKFYNTLTKKKEEFIPINRGIVKIYSCGPTVYNFQHIGNLRSALCWDFLKRSLRFLGFEVIDVINITDVGHLVSDEDDGEDKMIKASKKENKNPFDIAKFYEKAYINDLKKIHVILPKFMPRATDHIKEQVEIISELEKNGFTYKTQDGIYFDVSKFKDYGKLSGQSLEEKQAGARVKVDSEKKSPQDFALWKFLTKENKDHVMKWETPWGIGFPGWHLECSAMSHKYLGEEIDIHTGGIEHIPVHHENEIAQNTCSGKIKNINFWMHNGHMLINNEKMCKSLGNVFLISDLIEKGYSPIALRMLCLKTNYKKQINFTFENLDGAEKDIERINSFYQKLLNLKSINTKQDKIDEFVNFKMDEFTKALEDDLNIAKALGVLEEFMSFINKDLELNAKDIEIAINFIEDLNRVFGILKEKKNIPTQIIELAKKRKIAKENKDYSLADSIREEVKSKGFIIEDSSTARIGFLIKEN